MSSKFSSSLIFAGVVFAFLGLCVLPAAFGKQPDTATLGLGATIFSLGTLMISAGIYLKARWLQSTTPETPTAQDTRGRSGCELCGTEASVVHCKTHQLELCGNCLARHYDNRSCSYVPRYRANASKSTARAMAARHKA
jgi:ribosomal protein S14